jgi:hypothetical protein
VRRTERRRLPAAAGAFAALVVACGTSLRTVPIGPHLQSGPPPIIVDTPPPPARIERIPDDPGGDCAWLDGLWDWTGQTWEWTAGRWVVPPAGCHFALPASAWVPTTGRGQLFYTRGRWYRDGGGSCPEPRPCTAGAQTP